MTFKATNNRIWVTDNGATVFDTNEDIPHILGAGTYSATINFPDCGRNNNGFWDPYDHQEYQMVQVYVCGYRTESRYTCWYEQQYNPCLYSYGGGYSCDNKGSCSYTPPTCYGGYESVSVCGFRDEQVYSCQYENQWQWVWVAAYKYDGEYYAYDWTQSIVLGDLPYGQACNFLLTRATANRTAVGGVHVQPGDLAATIGGETFAFQGSALLEAGGKADGSRFLSRIISVIPDNVNKKLILEARHSNGYYKPGWTYEPTRSVASSFNITVTVYFGRFR